MPVDKLVPIELVRTAIAGLIKARDPAVSETGYVFRDLNQFRMEYVREILETDSGEISALEEDVLKSPAEQEMLSNRLSRQFEIAPTPGQRLADWIAAFGGSWSFIVLFGFFLVAWVVLNTLIVSRTPPDPYPFILLNLILSCVAAMQAPVIMMSQNRMEAKDRMRAEHDYKINLKAELEIRHLHEKLDHLLKH